MYEGRVKGLHFQNDHLASISSNGDVTVWTVDIQKQKVTELCTTNIGCRPICLTIINLEDFADEYILKRENADDEQAAEITALQNKAHSANKLGKVVIEVDDDEETNNEVKEHKSKNKVRIDLISSQNMITFYLTRKQHLILFSNFVVISAKNS